MGKKLHISKWYNQKIKKKKERKNLSHKTKPLTTYFQISGYVWDNFSLFKWVELGVHYL